MEELLAAYANASIALHVRADRMLLRVEAVRPAPARDEIWFVELEGLGKLFNVSLGIDARSSVKDVRGHPGQIQRRQGPEQVATIDGAQPECEQEIVNNSHP